MTTKTACYFWTITGSDLTPKFQDVKEYAEHMNGSMSMMMEADDHLFDVNLCRFYDRRTTKVLVEWEQFSQNLEAGDDDGKLLDAIYDQIIAANSIENCGIIVYAFPNARWPNKIESSDGSPAWVQQVPDTSGLKTAEDLFELKRTPRLYQIEVSMP